MAPHHALTIADIISIILSNLRPMDPEGENGRLARQDLLSAILCCKNFMEPGLDVLWHSIYSIDPILRLIPGMREIDRTMILLGKLDLNGISGSRFHYYSRKIKHFHPYDYFTIDPSTSIQLFQLDDGLLPLLTSLEIPGDDYFIDYRSILPFVLPAFLRSRSITEVICNFDRDHIGDELDGVVLSLVKHANVKVLRRLTLGGSLYPPYISPLSHLNHLQSVSLNLSERSWTFDVFDLFSRLQLIDVHLDFHTASSPPMETMTSSAFPVMTALSLRGAKPLIYYMLNGIAGDNLESIQIDERFAECNHDDAYQHAHFYQRLAKFTLLRSISHTVEEMERDPLSPHELGIIPMSVIQPLTGLKYLEELQLMFLAPWFHAPDPEISIAASTWPHLKVLGLKPIPLSWPVNTQHPTLTSLHSLALNCPKLVYLAINVDMQASVSLSDLPPISSHCPLKTLELYGNGFNDSVDMAQVLEYLFPQLTDVTYKEITAIESYFGFMQDY